MVTVRFAPSPTGALHLGGALTAVANRSFADERSGTFLVRIDDTDSERVNYETEQMILDDLAWLGVESDAKPVRQSERAALYTEAAEALVEKGYATSEDGALRSTVGWRPTLIRSDGSATYHLASVVDDGELQVTHVIRGRDHLPNTELHEHLTKALGYTVPEYIHHGLLVGEDGKKLSKRHGATSVSELRAEGVPPEAARAYLKELGLPKHDVCLDRGRIERLSVDALASFSVKDFASRIGVGIRVVPALRGARNLREAQLFAAQITTFPELSTPRVQGEKERTTIQRLVDLRERGEEFIDEDTARALIREIKAVGGNLRVIRRALTGVERGPELWTVLYALERNETLARLGHWLEHRLPES